MIHRIGKYEITGELGKGGFGRVYKAFDPTVGRVVAIKVLTSKEDPGLVARFHAEAMTAGNLHHKNVVTIHEFGEDHGLQFLVMEYLDGVDLHRLMSQKTPLTLLEKMEIMSQAAQGLRCAHEHGVVHRDVKPANIMRLSDGSVKIMDFGIARLTRDTVTRLTQTGFMVGTVHYMAPERFKGGEMDVLCDVWAYGVVYYEMLTGVHPFQAKDAPAMMYRITIEDPPPIPSFLPECPPRLNTAVQRLLAKDRDNRYQSLEDFLFDTDPIMRDIARAQVPALVARVGDLMQKNQIEEAQPLVRRILELDSENREARQWREELRERLRQHAVRPRIDELLRQAEMEAAKRNYSAAIEKLDSALRLDPVNTTLRNRLEELRLEESSAKRAERLVSEARRELDREDLTGAFAHINEALATDPKNTAAPPLLDQVRAAMEDRQRRALVRSSVAKAKGLMLMQAFDEAIAILNRLISEDPQNHDVRERLAEAQHLKQAQEAQDRINRGIGESKELLKSGAYDKAAAILEVLERQSPGNAAIQPLLAYAREQSQIEKKAAAVNELANRAGAECDARQFEQSLSTIEKALELDPGNTRLLHLKKSVLDAQRVQTESDAATATQLLTDLIVVPPPAAAREQQAVEPATTRTVPAAARRESPRGFRAWYAVLPVAALLLVGAYLFRGRATPDQKPAHSEPAHAEPVRPVPPPAPSPPQKAGNPAATVDPPHSVPEKPVKPPTVEPIAHAGAKPLRTEGPVVSKIPKPPSAASPPITPAAPPADEKSTPAKPLPPPSPAAVNEEDYGGSDAVDITWTNGQLPDGGRLVIQGNSVLEGGGVISKRIPAVTGAVTVKLDGLAVQEQPSRSNGYRLVLANKTGRTLMRIGISWQRARTPAR